MLANETGPETLLQLFSGEKFDSKPAWAWPFKNYKTTIVNLARHFAMTSLGEIGGGRAPLLAKDVVDAIGAEYAILDVSKAELELAPDWLHKVQFDIGAENLGRIQPTQYDLMFSHMVMEHVRDVRKAYGNIYHLLKDGGIVINFHPTLYAVPFVINRLSPEILTRPLVELFDKHRGAEGRPKFPAYYSWCVSTAKAEKMIRGIGFREVLILPFWGHSYFDRIPGLREIDRAVVNFARSRALRSFSSYAYTIARK